LALFASGFWLTPRSIVAGKPSSTVNFIATWSGRPLIELPRISLNLPSPGFVSLLVSQ
jgi:hypothetical protein